MQNAYVVTGRLRDTHTVDLDETLPIAAARVRVVLEVLSSPPLATTYQDVMDKIRIRQQQRGHRAPSLADVDARLQGERDSWE